MTLRHFVVDVQRTGSRFIKGATTNLRSRSKRPSVSLPALPRLVALVLTAVAPGIGVAALIAVETVGAAEDRHALEVAVADPFCGRDELDAALAGEQGQDESYGLENHGKGNSTLIA
mmetsp:Transcript_11486/g.24206  ORF Transcript_11486/g.24206 Transcript_11486/m.24206 type:complete len:117 (-) Transcript_11486:74-424(-)